MSSYMTCPSCGFFLGKITEKYEIEKEKICSNPTSLQEKKDEEMSKLITSSMFVELGLKRYCCKMRLMSYKDMVEDILPVSESHS